MIQTGAASLHVGGPADLFQGQRVELSFANSAAVLTYYIGSVDGRVVRLAASADDDFVGGAVQVDQLLSPAGASPGASTGRGMVTGGHQGPGRDAKLPC